MSEPAAKRRLREWKRRISTDLTLQGYEVETSQNSNMEKKMSEQETADQLDELKDNVERFAKNYQRDREFFIQEIRAICEHLGINLQYVPDKTIPGHYVAISKNQNNV